MRLRERNVARDRRAIECEFLFRAFNGEHEPSIASLRGATGLAKARVKEVLQPAGEGVRREGGEARG
jgi:hypothetical protein